MASDNKPAEAVPQPVDADASRPKRTFADVLKGRPGQATQLFLQGLTNQPVAKIRTDEAKVAIITVHGMGVQIPLQAIQDLTLGLLQHGNVGIKNQVYGSEVVPKSSGGSQTVTWAKFDATNGGEAERVKVFEAFWSPIPKGTTPLVDVLTFLVTSGVQGFKWTFSKFNRWMFGQDREFSAKPSTAAVLLLALGVILALFAFQYLLLGAVVPGELFHVDPAAKALAADVLLHILGFGALVGVLVACSGWIKSVLISWAALFAIILLAAFTAFSGLVVALLAVHKEAAQWPVLRAIYFGSDWLDSHLGQWAPWIAVAAAFLIRWVVQGFLVDFAGDLAAYLCGFKASKYQKVRDQIQTKLADVFDYVYKQKFDRVIVVGHSEGSIIAYDALNATLLRHSGDPHFCIPDRTQALITFGCPLDKSAYLFRSDSPRADWLREALDSSRQPLIDSKPIRRSINWINVWSPFDIISGHLDYYDGKEPGLNVDNRRDQEAYVPLAAHGDYWQHKELPLAVVEQIFAPVPTP